MSYIDSIDRQDRFGVSADVGLHTYFSGLTDVGSDVSTPLALGGGGAFGLADAGLGLYDAKYGGGRDDWRPSFRRFTGIGSYVAPGSRSAIAESKKLDGTWYSQSNPIGFIAPPFASGGWASSASTGAAQRPAPPATSDFDFSSPDGDDETKKSKPAKVKPPSTPPPPASVPLTDVDRTGFTDQLTTAGYDADEAKAIVAAAEKASGGDRTKTRQALTGVPTKNTGDPTAAARALANWWGTKVAGLSDDAAKRYADEVAFVAKPHVIPAQRTRARREIPESWMGLDYAGSERQGSDVYTSYTVGDVEGAAATQLKTQAKDGHLYHKADGWYVKDGDHFVLQSAPAANVEPDGDRLYLTRGDHALRDGLTNATDLITALSAPDQLAAFRARQDRVTEAGKKKGADQAQSAVAAITEMVGLPAEKFSLGYDASGAKPALKFDFKSENAAAIAASLARVAGDPVAKEKFRQLFGLLSAADVSVNGERQVGFFADPVAKLQKLVALETPQHVVLDPIDLTGVRAQKSDETADAYATFLQERITEKTDAAIKKVLREETHHPDGTIEVRGIKLPASVSADFIEHTLKPKLSGKVKIDKWDVAFFGYAGGAAFDGIKSVTVTDLLTRADQALASADTAARDTESSARVVSGAPIEEHAAQAAAIAARASADAASVAANVARATSDDARRGPAVIAAEAYAAAATAWRDSLAAPDREAGAHAAQLAAVSADQAAASVAGIALADELRDKAAAAKSAAELAVEFAERAHQVSSDKEKVVPAAPVPEAQAAVAAAGQAAHGAELFATEAATKRDPDAHIAEAAERIADQSAKAAAALATAAAAMTDAATRQATVAAAQAYGDVASASAQVALAAKEPGSDGNLTTAINQLQGQVDLANQTAAPLSENRTVAAAVAAVPRAALRIDSLETARANAAIASTPAASKTDAERARAQQKLEQLSAQFERAEKYFIEKQMSLPSSSRTAAYRGLKAERDNISRRLKDVTAIDDGEITSALAKVDGLFGAATAAYQKAEVEDAQRLKAKVHETAAARIAGLVKKFEAVRDGFVKQLPVTQGVALAAAKQAFDRKADAISTEIESLKDVEDSERQAAEAMIDQAQADASDAYTARVAEAEKNAHDEAARKAEAEAAARAAAAAVAAAPATPVATFDHTVTDLTHGPVTLAGQTIDWQLPDDVKADLDRQIVAIDRSVTDQLDHKAAGVHSSITDLPLASGDGWLDRTNAAQLDDYHRSAEFAEAYRSLFIPKYVAALRKTLEQQKWKGEIRDRRGRDISTAHLSLADAFAQKDGRCAERTTFVAAALEHARQSALVGGRLQGVATRFAYVQGVGEPHVCTIIDHDGSWTTYDISFPQNVLKQDTVNPRWERMQALRQRGAPVVRVNELSLGQYAAVLLVTRGKDKDIAANQVLGIYDQAVILAEGKNAFVLSEAAIAYYNEGQKALRAGRPTDEVKRLLDRAQVLMEQALANTTPGHDDPIVSQQLNGVRQNLTLAANELRSRGV